MIEIPNIIMEFLNKHIGECNNKIANDLSTFPGTHEESLDLAFISHFAKNQGPYKFGSKWTLKFDAHYIGGGRHFRNWEVADLGFMIIFRKNGKIVRSKLAFLQSKKLYANAVRHMPVDPFYRQGMGRLLVTDEEHEDVVAKRKFIFEEKSKYKAFRKNSDQHDAMSSFSNRFGVKLYYLFYNPTVIPLEIASPVEIIPDIKTNIVGCRVVPKPMLDEALEKYADNHMPTYGELKYLLSGEFTDRQHDAGWRLEHFVNDLFIGCKEGLIDDSPNFSTMISLLNQKSAPISSALSITFDLTE
jgi:hypothetical protein